jgi:hypothetical protein
LRFYCAHYAKSEIRYGVIAGKEIGHHAGVYYTALTNQQIVNLQREYTAYLESIYGSLLFTFI